MTGASSGIGAAIARELASRDARLTLVARSRERLERVALEIEATGGTARVEPADLSSIDEIEALTGRVLAASGVPDVLVNNAGAGRWRAIDETAPGEAAQMMALPYLAAFELTRAFGTAMIAKRGGRVVCMTSVAGYTHPRRDRLRGRSLGDARLRQPITGGSPRDRHRRNAYRGVGG